MTHRIGTRQVEAGCKVMHYWLMLMLMVLSGCSSTVVEEPPPEPPRTAVCCGCLCLDESWSCAESTCLAADGGVVALAPEMGLLEVGAEPYASSETDLEQRRGVRARVSYTFYPADDAPRDKPLVVLFNGGPGSSTAILFGLNTGPKTLDPERTGGAPWADNPHSWTAFANLLYIDMPGTGFGYLLPDEDGQRVSTGELYDPWHDAAQFVTVLIRFLKRHPQIRANQVVLAGESYGGTRAAAMLHLLLHYDSLLDGNFYRNARLHDELQEHYEAVLGVQTVATADEVAKQFAGQLLIQPYVGKLYYETLPPGCLSDGDVYQCNEPHGFAGEQIGKLVDVITQPALLQQITGADLATIAWLRPEHRAGVYGRGDDDVSYDDSALIAALGELSMGDRYYQRYVDWAWLPWINNPVAGLLVLSSGYDVETFITNGHLDMVVPTPLFPAHFASISDWVSHVDHQQENPPGAARPGILSVSLSDTFGAEPRTRNIRFPSYPHAGHAVSQRAAAELAEDVGVWLGGLSSQ